MLESSMVRQRPGEANFDVKLYPIMTLKTVQKLRPVGGENIKNYDLRPSLRRRRIDPKRRFAARAKSSQGMNASFVPQVTASSRPWTNMATNEATKPAANAQSNERRRMAEEECDSSGTGCRHGRLCRNRASMANEPTTIAR